MKMYHKQCFILSEIPKIFLSVHSVFIDFIIHKHVLGVLLELSVVSVRLFMVFLLFILAAGSVPCLV